MAREREARINPIPAEGFVRLPQVLAHFPVSAATWWQMVREGRAPKSIKLGPKTTVWKAAEFRAFLEQRASAADGART